MIAENKRQSLKTEAGAAGKFALVGIAATLTHAGLSATLLEAAVLPAMLANLAGFIIAFGVSFCGHYYWSFAHLRQKSTARKAMVRFFLIAVSGFALNSSVLALWLSFTPWAELLGLLVSIAIVPALTFVAARMWAFSHTPAKP